MSTNKDLEVQINSLKEDVGRLKKSNMSTKDELAILKTNYTSLVEDVNSRLEVVHEKLFRKTGANV